MSAITAMPTVLQPRFDAIPQELRSRPHWVVWRAEEREGKLTKIPYCTTDQRASTTDPSTWLTFFDARRLYEAGGFDGIGYVFSGDDPYTGVDLDAGLPEEERTQIVRHFDSYTELSPSGTGVHILVRAKLTGAGGRRRGPVEVYSSGRFFTVTGRIVDGARPTIEDRQAVLDAWVEETFGPDRSSAGPSAPVVWEPAELSPEDERAIQERRERDAKFRQLWDGDTALWEGDAAVYSSRSEADLALCNMLAALFDRDPAKIDAAFRKSRLMRPKWNERRGEKTYGQTTIAKALEEEEEEDTAMPRGPDPQEPAQNATARDAVAETAPQRPAWTPPPEPLIALYGAPVKLPSYDVERGVLVTDGPAPWVGGSRLLGEFIQIAREIAPGLPDDWALAALLCGASVLVPHLRVENLNLSLWMLGIARQSAGKGLILDAAQTVVRAAATRLPRDWFGSSTTTVRDVAEGASPLATLSSGTPQGLLKLAQDGPVLVVFEEASSFMEQVNRLDHQAGFKQTLCQLYDGRSLSHQIRDRHGVVVIERPHVAMLAAINQEDFTRVFTRDDFTSGFLSRMLVVAPDFVDHAPRQGKEPEALRDLGRRLGEHLRAHVREVRYVRYAKPRLSAEDLRRLGGRRRVLGENLLWAMLRAAGLAPGTGEIVDLDAPQDEDDLETPRGRDIARMKKLAALFELLEEEPTIQAFEPGDRLPTGAAVGDRYLGVRDQNVLRALAVVLRARAYAQRALGWLHESADVKEQRAILRVLGRAGRAGMTESDLLRRVRSRGTVFLKRNLEALERSGKITLARGRRGRGTRYILSLYARPKAAEGVEDGSTGGGEDSGES
jgi:putative DNA primase/helicase